MGRAEPLVQRILGVPRIAMAHAVWDRYVGVGGSVLSRGLAYGALFALVPAIIVLVSVAALMAGDPATRQRIVDTIASLAPPLAPLVDQAIATARTLAPATGILGLVGLMWSASSFVRALDGAFRVVFWDDGQGRSPLRIVVAVVAVAVGMVAAGAILVIGPIPEEFLARFGIQLGGVRSVASAVVVVGLVGLAYALVPRPRPRLRALLEPAVVVGLAVFLLTSLFSVLSPLLVGSAQLYGAFGALFLGLIWLNYVTEALLVGAAWVAERDRRTRVVAGPGEIEVPGR